MFRVQAVVLNSCWGGHGLGGVAAAFSAAGVPLVVGMQLEVLQSVAQWLARFVYGRGLAIADPLEQSLAEYRRACAQGWASGPGSPDWGIPVLYLGAADSALLRRSTIAPYPVDFRPLIGRHVPVVGRGFLFESIADWRKAGRARGEGGFCLLIAEPGFGKTAFAAKWLQTEPPWAHFFFQRASEVNSLPGLDASLASDSLGTVLPWVA